MAAFNLKRQLRKIAIKDVKKVSERADMPKTHQVILLYQANLFILSKCQLSKLNVIGL